MVSLNKAQGYFASLFLASAAFFAAPDANAMRISEYNKLEDKDQVTYLQNVIKEHIDIVAKQDLSLAKESLKYAYAKTEMGGTQGFGQLLLLIKRANNNGSADKVDVEFAFRVLLDAEWKSKGLTHNGQPASTTMFFPKGYQVAFNPADKGDKNIAQQSPAVK